MRSLSAGELLDVWEQGLMQDPVKRAMSLLAACCGEITEENIAHLPVGERDMYLLMIRERVFGTSLEAVTRCPSCGELLETAIDSSQIHIPATSSSVTIPPLERDGFIVRFRPADSMDLAAIAGLDAASAKDILLTRCCTESLIRGDPVSPGQLPEDMQEAVLEAMGNADPLANTTLRLVCPSCGKDWQEPIDILSFFWDEIGTWAERTLDEVHVLAQAYGWTESEVLAMSAARRQMYLGKVME